MSIEFGCEYCGKSFKVGDHLAGKRARCKGCGQTMTVPSPDGGDGSLELLEEGAAIPFRQDPTDAGPDLADLASLEAKGKPVQELAAVSTPEPASRAEPRGPALRQAPRPPQFALASPVVIEADDEEASRPIPRGPLIELPGGVEHLLLLALLAAGCFVPIGMAVYTATRSASPGWQILFVSLKWLAIFALVNPLCVVGARLGGRIMSYDLPDAPYWRMLAVATVSGAFLMVAALLGINPSMGMGLLAVPLTFLTFWVLYRLRLLDAIVGYLLAAVFGAIAMLLVGALIIGIVASRFKATGAQSSPLAVLDGFWRGDAAALQPPAPDTSTTTADSSTVKPRPDPDRMLFEEPPRSVLWALDSRWIDQLGSEVSCSMYRIRPPKAMLPALGQSDPPRYDLAYQGGNGQKGDLRVEVFPRRDVRQKQPFILREGTAPGAVTPEIKLGTNNSQVDFGGIGDLAFTRVRDTVGDRQQAIYVAADANVWVKITIACPTQDAATFELLDNVVRTVRRARPDEPVIDPVTPAVAAAHLADDPVRAKAALEKMGPAAEDAVLPCLKHQDPAVRAAAAQLLEKIGTAKSVPALREAAKDPDATIVQYASAALVRLDPQPVPPTGTDTTNTIPGGEAVTQAPPVLTPEQVALAALEKVGAIVKSDPDKGVAVSFPEVPVDPTVLAHLKSVNQLESLTFEGAKLTDEGAAQLAGLTGLKSLNLVNTRITDKALVHLKGLSRLESLDLSQTQITDAGLANIKDLTALTTLGLGRIKAISDAGLVHLKGLTNLERLRLQDNKITDAGLQHLKGLAKLKTLFLQSNRITEQGVEQLKKALPKASIYS